MRSFIATLLILLAAPTFGQEASKPDPQASPSARAATSALRPLGAFQIAYQLTFELDQCGDDRLGKLYRQAIVERFDECPFTTDARQSFHSWTTETDRKANEALRHFIEQHGKLPDRLDGMKETCEEQRNTPSFLQLKTQLDQYAAGKVTAAELLTDPCDAPAVAP